jgi:hypothetical protein
MTVLLPLLLTQIISNPTQWYINTSMMSNRVFNSVVANSMLLRKGSPGGPVAKAMASAMQFRQVGSLLPRQLAAKVPAEKRDQAVRFFQISIDLYRQTARKDGFPSNDLAYALEYFVVNNYHLYHNLIGSPNGVTMPQERAIYAQFQRILGPNAEIRKMSDAQKQQTTEALAIMFGIGYQANQTRDPKLVEQSRDLAKQSLEKLFGTSVEKIKITNQGIEL